MRHYRMLFTLSLPVFLLAWFSISLAYVHIPWTEELYRYIEDEYGKSAAERARALQALLLRESGRPIEEEIHEVNRFFNDVVWVSDSLHWGKKDYWQTPFETLVEFEGDCEDIAIAKYNALRILGIPDEQLELVYGFLKGEAHMVLAYSPTDDADPLVLDSFNTLVLPASQRNDFRPVYEFNSTTLWLSDPHMKKLGKGKPEHLALEDELKNRLATNRHLLQMHNAGNPVVPFAITEI